MDTLPCGCSNKKSGECCALGLFCVECACKTPKVLCSVKEQVCCCVATGALPPNSDVPALCGYFFISCYPKFGICKKVDSQRNASHSNRPKKGNSVAVGVQPPGL